MNIILSLFQWILDVGFRASLLSIAVLLLQAALRPVISARARYLLWLPVLLVLLLPILPRSRWSAENLFTSHTHGPAPVLAPSTVTVIEEATPGSHVASAPSTDWKQSAAALIWAAGAALSLAGGLALSSATLRRFMQVAEKPDDSLTNMIATLSAELRLRHPPRVILSGAVESPAVTGLLRPLLLLPADFGTAFAGNEARLVLKHELMHLKRFDLQINALVFLLNAFHWFNPILWLATWCARQDREVACDAQVLASEPSDCRSDYGHVLLKGESGRYTPWLSIGFVGIFEPGRVLRSRIKAIADYRHPGPLSTMLSGAAILLLAVVGATHAQTAQPAQAGAGAIVTIPGVTDANSDGLITKEYKLASSFASQLAQGQTAFDFLNAHGVQFPPGASAVYFPSTSRLIVHNTSSNIELVDALAGKFPAPPEAPTPSPPPGTIQSKLDLVIPKMELRDATLRDAVNYLRRQSIQLDTTEPDPSRRGVKIVLQVDTKLNTPRITLSLTNIPLIEALKYVCQLSNLKLRIDPNAAVLESPDANSNEIVTKEYWVRPSFASQMAPGETMMEFFTVNGVQFPTGANVLYFPSNGRLIVHDTSSNLDLVDALTEKFVGSPPAPTPTPVPGSVQDKLSRIIPKLEMHEMTARDAFNYLRQQSIQLDTAEPDPSRRGVNITLAPGIPRGQKITVSLTNIPLIEALKYVCQLDGLKLAVNADGVIISAP